MPLLMRSIGSSSIERIVPERVDRKSPEREGCPASQISGDEPIQTSPPQRPRSASRPHLGHFRLLHRVPKADIEVVVALDGYCARSSRTS
jgi:hypothetical protein